jgi:UDP-N-acetylglucosamine enolpyruvyl transferase
MTGVEHWKRGYDHLEKKLQSLEAKVKFQQVNATKSINF